MSKWTYLTRVIPNISDLLQPLEDAIRQKFLTSLTGQNAFNDVTRELMALPVRLGVLGIINPTAEAPSHHDASTKITTPLTTLIMEQSHQYPNTTKVEQIQIKKDSVKAWKHHQSQAAAELRDSIFVCNKNTKVYKDSFNLLRTPQECMSEGLLQYCRPLEVWHAFFNTFH